MRTPHSAGSAVYPITRNGSAHVPAGTTQRAQRLTASLNRSSCCANAPVEEGAGLERRMHRDDVLDNADRRQLLGSTSSLGVLRFYLGSVAHSTSRTKVAASLRL
jgi:hypothetical protein